MDDRTFEQLFQLVRSFVAYAALAVPVTAAITNFAKVGLKYLEQRHSIAQSRVEQSHGITREYLDRTLNPDVPLAIRHQLLRFLATPDESGLRLQKWAANELKRTGEIVDEVDKAVLEAERALLRAKSTQDLAAAERRLLEASAIRVRLLEPPPRPAITAAALRAGFIDQADLGALSMKGENLARMSLAYRKLVGSCFDGADLTDASFQGSDLRSSSFQGAIICDTSFYSADLRSANFSGAKIGDRTNFRQAHLAGADFTGAEFSPKVDLRATFDEHTKWPEGFDPLSQGAVPLHGKSQPDKIGPA